MARDCSRRFTPSYNDRAVETMAAYGPTLEREGTMAALRLRKCPVFYIFALERAVESRNRVLENQLLVTVRGREKERKIFERAVLYLFSLRSFVRSPLGSSLSTYGAVSSFAPRKGTRGALIDSDRGALCDGDKVCNDDYFEETFSRDTRHRRRTHAWVPVYEGARMCMRA